MSDNWIAVIPEDPLLVPEAAKQARARDRFAQIALDADEVRIVLSEKVRFFDCGTNFERVACPACGADIALEWWQERMDQDFRDGFLLAKYATPCCHAPATLHELVYEWPQGFGRFAIDAMNPNIGKLGVRHRKGLEEILGTKLRVIYQHL